MNKLVHRTKLFVGRNGSTILTGMAGVGLIATAVFTAKATPKAMTRVENAREEKGEELTKLETAIAAAPAYIPPILTGVATLACMFGANVLNKRQQASLMSAYALVDDSYREYKKKVEELYGEGSNQKVQAEIAKDKYEESDLEPEDGMKLFYDEFSGRYFESTIEKVQRAEYEINRDLNMQCYATLNDFYDYLGLIPIDGGEDLGWSADMNAEYYWQSWIDFIHHDVVMDDGLEVTIITMVIEPTLGWEEY
jgi:hypothetical protein